MGDAGHTNFPVTEDMVIAAELSARDSTELRIAAGVFKVGGARAFSLKPVS
jgi:hypothetical protein